MNQIPLTATGAERLKLELKELKSVKRPAIIEAIAVARDHGDLKENAEYHAARGCTVELLDVATDKEVSYQIVGDIEADINENRIAISSPIARALIGKEEGEEAVVDAPGGTMEYVITAVQYK
jgi:transcription elongation factor GreA